MPARLTTTRASSFAFCSMTTSTPAPWVFTKQYSEDPLAFIRKTLRMSSERSTYAHAKAVAYVSSGNGGLAAGASAVTETAARGGMVFSVIAPAAETRRVTSTPLAGNAVGWAASLR